VRPQVTVPVRLTVSGEPRIAVSPSALDFGSGFLGSPDTLMCG